MKSPLGVILAGGQSRRMEGRDKTVMELDGEKLVFRVQERLAKQVPSIIVNANGDLDRFSELKLPVVPDTVSGFVGPLAGVLTGMRWAIQQGSFSHILTAASDTPFFPLDYARKMIAQSEASNARIALAMSDRRRHPVFGLWDVTLADELEKFLVEEEGRKVMLFVERYSNTMVEFAIEQNDPFFNVNTPADMEKAEKIVVGTGV